MVKLYIYIGFAWWNFATGPLVSHSDSSEGNLGAQEGKPAIDMREGLGLAWPFTMTCSDQTNNHIAK